MEQNQKLLLQYIQPGLLGLMDGAVSTLAPIFAVAFATKSPHITLLVGFSASIGAAISMAFAEALSDTGEHTGRGKPLNRGATVGIMTFIGGILHTLPFFLPTISGALSIAYVVVGIELIVIAYIRNHYFKMNFYWSVIQVIFGGLLVVAAGILIGSA
jgi:VIT1/CCC1 family predicted Fe2+/Mn2+ transporter